MSQQDPSNGEYPQLPFGAHAISALGPTCARLALDHFEPHATLFTAHDPADEYQQQLAEVARRLGTEKWSDAEASKLFRHILTAEDAPIEPTKMVGLRKWVQFHSDDSAAVIDCLSVTPPPEVSITRLLSRAGSQKLVFLATWQLTRRQVVIKKLIAPPQEAERITQRELQAHPLKTEHPHIIRTHILGNARGERFLVEEYLPTILSDSWSASSVAEAANLLVDVGGALQHLHSNLNLVHGDIKPDNIGMKDGHFILLDFGICRNKDEYSPDVTATGSLRTRAPEVLAVSTYGGDPSPIDIWALGATVFKAVAGRFPLIDFNEPVPRISKPEQRLAAESALAERASSDWDKWVDLDLIENPGLRTVLEHALARDPSARPTASELVEEVRQRLTAFIRDSSSENNFFTPTDEWDQIKQHLLPRRHLMPASQQARLHERIGALMDFPGFDDRAIEEMQRFQRDLEALVG